MWGKPTLAMSVIRNHCSRASATNQAIDVQPVHEALVVVFYILRVEGTKNTRPKAA